MSRTPDSALPTVSVVIPIWNDAAALRGCLSVLSQAGDVLEVIIADASEGCECRDIAHAAGARVIACPEPNRGRQMNAAAAVARGDVLLFHHADTAMSPAHLRSLRETMADPAVVGGAFYRCFNPLHSRRKWMEPLIRRINDRSTIWGDQSMFVRRCHFERLGGFKPIPLFEDMEFSKRLRRSGPVRLIDPPLYSSARRHRKYGSWRASLEIFAAVQLYRLGVSPERIHEFYYRRRNGAPQGPPVEAESG